MEARKIGDRPAARADGSRLLRRYLAEIGSIRVLDAAEERDLARRLRDAETELRQRLEPDPFFARFLLERWQAIRLDGRVTGQLSRTHEPPARDRSRAVDRNARALAVRLAAGAEGPSVAALVRAVDPRPELLHEALQALARAVATGADPGLAQTLEVARAVERRGRAAKDTFIRHNLRLVVHQAKRFRHYDVPFLDLIQEGAMGLIRAVEKFDERLGNRFATYAIWWIQQSCMRLVQQSARTVRLPAPVQDEIRRYRRAEESLGLRRPGSAGAGEVARALGLPPAEVQDLERFDSPALRLDEPAPGREGELRGDSLAAAVAGADECADRAHLAREVATLLEALPRRDREILRSRFGFVDGEGQTLQEVAGGLGLSRERVRQLERRALARLEAAARGAGLDVWLAGRDLSG